MIKSDEIGRPDSCLNKAGDDEPLFVLRANDPLAAATVEYWAELAARTAWHDVEKVDGAYFLAQMMRNWRLERESS